MRLIFFSKHWKFIADSKKAKKKKKKKQQKIDSFSDNLIKVGNGKFFLLIREYSKLAVSVLSNSLKISNPIRNNFF